MVIHDPFGLTRGAARIINRDHCTLISNWNLERLGARNPVFVLVLAAGTYQLQSMQVLFDGARNRFEFVVVYEDSGFAVFDGVGEIAGG